MIRFFLLFIFMTSLAYAQVGEVRSVRAASDAWIMRNSSKITLNEGMTLEMGDSIHTENAQVNLILYPKIQLSLVHDTEITITKHLIEDDNDRTTSLIDLIKGLIRIQVTRDSNETVDQKVNAKDVTFAVRGTEYEVSSTDEDAELDVMEGEVEVSSPYVQTLVPEIVKPNQGFRFIRKDRQFNRRAHKERIKDARFLRREEVRERWENKKANRLVRKLEKERNNGLKDKKLENVKERVEGLLKQGERRGRGR